MARTDPDRPSRVLILGGRAGSLVNFRGPLIRKMLARGHRVTAASGEPDEGVAETLSRWGAAYEPVALGRTGLNPVADLATLASLYRLMRRVRPDILLAYTIKPVVYGLLAARAAGVRRRIAMIEGLGYAFTDGAEAKRRLLRRLIAGAFRVSIPHAHALLVLNRDDESYFRDCGIVRAGQELVRVAGTGIDLAHYAPAPLPEGPVTFLMIARLLADKGVREFAAAARLVKRAHPEAKFVLVGRLDANPAAIGVDELLAWEREGVVHWTGELDDVRPALAACHVFVLPSYREGMPRTVLEAMASGRAVVTTDAPGCRETVVEGKNGFLVPPRDAEALAEAMLRLAGDRGFVAAAGQASLALARARFDVHRVNEVILEMMEADSTVGG